MTRQPVLAALALAAVACGPIDSAEDATSLAAEGSPLAKSASAAGGLQLSAASIAGGELLLVTVSAGSGARIYLTYPKSLFAGPAWVRIPSGGRATVALYTSPFVTAPVSATISARTSSPDPALWFAQTVTLVPPASPPAARPQVASAVLTPATVVSGGTSTLEVTLTSPAPAEGAAVLVAITNDFLGLDADVAPVLLVPAGATRASATIRTHLSSPTATSVVESVIANLFGGTFQGGPLVIKR